MGRLLDYEQMLGLITPCAREISASWDDVNLASGDDNYVQKIGNYFLDFHAQLIHRPELSGLVESSGSKANERALKIAKAKTGKSKVLVSNLAHSSIQDAAVGQKDFFVGIGLEPVIVYADPTNGFQVDEDDLSAKISKHGKDIAVVVSTYGTTPLGHAENLAIRDSVKQLRKDGAWLHIDAAYGGCYTLFSTLITPTLPLADSYTLDPYKFVGKPGASLLLTDARNLRKGIIPYYEISPLTVDTTLSFGPVVAWIQMIKDYERAGLRELANDCIVEARLAAATLRNAGIKVVYGPKMSVVPVALPSAAAAKYIRENLKQSGFKVGKLHLEGDNYLIDGFRFTVTPRVPEFHKVRELTSTIIKMI